MQQRRAYVIVVRTRNLPAADPPSVDRLQRGLRVFRRLLGFDVELVENLPDGVTTEQVRARLPIAGSTGEAQRRAGS